MSNGPIALARRIQRDYAGDQPRPLGGYLLVLGAYAVFAGSAVGLGAALGKRPPKKLPTRDLLLTSVATHKLARLLTKDAVTSPLRAPLTRFAESAGAGEITETVTAHGVGHAVGEMLICPLCLDVWIGTGFAAGSVFLPRLTRLGTSLLTVVAAADFLHLAYEGVKQASGEG